MDSFKTVRWACRALPALLAVRVVQARRARCSDHLESRRAGLALPGGCIGNCTIVHGFARRGTVAVRRCATLSAVVVMDTVTSFTFCAASFPIACQTDFVRCRVAARVAVIVVPIEIAFTLDRTDVVFLLADGERLSRIFARVFGISTLWGEKTSCVQGLGPKRSMTNCTVPRRNQN